MSAPDHKLHFYISEQDFFYRNQDVRRFQEFLNTSRNPDYEGTFAAHAPSGADLSWK